MDQHLYKIKLKLIDCLCSCKTRNQLYICIKWIRNLDYYYLVPHSIFTKFKLRIKIQCLINQLENIYDNLRWKY